ncbi:MAG: response regulator [Planctomycetales bacterium]|nr:response regulator [Planctomycetales bacterium]MCA9166366.1 response regulator [Planctomycetales bacterium]
MLVLTRKTRDRISFPQVGITVHFVRVRAGQVRVGIEAPREIVVVRDDLHGEDAAANLIRRQLLRLPREMRHTLRNQLHEVSVGLHLYREQLRAGLDADAELTFHEIKQAVRRLDESEILQPDTPPTGPHVVSSRSIAVLEDNENERQMLSTFLRLKGYQVVDFSNGEEAMDYFEAAEPPSVVLVDMHMPVCDGPTTIRAMRDRDQFSDTSIFALSGSTPDENGLPIGRTGVDRWFPKPLNAESLVNALDQEFRAES